MSWRLIQDFPNYSVSSLGLVRRDDRDRVLIPRQNKQGICMVSLSHGSVVKTRSVALLVAKEFLPKPRNDLYNTVIHFNGDKTDCRKGNLDWRPRPTAVRYHRMFNEEPLRHSVYIPELNRYYGSLREFCVDYGLVENDVHQGIIHNRPLFHYGFLVYETKEKYQAALRAGVVEWENGKLIRNF